MPFAARVSRICEANPASAPASKLKATIFRLASPLRITSAGAPSGGRVIVGAGVVSGGVVGAACGEGVGVTAGVGGIGFAEIVMDGDGEREGLAESDAPVRLPQPAAAKMSTPMTASQ